MRLKGGVVVRKKYGRVRRKENVLVFPGTFEKLVETGIHCVETELFEEAVKAFDQAILYEPDYPDFLGPYAVALYETKDFTRAKAIAANLLQSGTENYIDSMELYLTISIQLQEYEEVEMTIETLIDEGIIPHEQMTKFNYLRELNNRLSMRYPNEYSNTSEATFTLDEFIEMNNMAQQHALASIEGTDISAMVPVLIDIAESVHFSPLAVTFALTLLCEANYQESLTIQKFGLETAVIPANLSLPGRDPKTADVLEELERILIKDPSKLDMGKALIEKFTITAFPFDWGDYHYEEIAKSYVLYIKALFTGDQLPDTELCLLIQRMDMESDLENI